MLEEISKIGAADDEIPSQHARFVCCARALRGRCAFILRLMQTTWISLISFCVCSSRVIQSVTFTAFHRVILAVTNDQGESEYQNASPSTVTSDFQAHTPSTHTRWYSGTSYSPTSSLLYSFVRRARTSSAEAAGKVRFWSFSLIFVTFGILLDP